MNNFRLSSKKIYKDSRSSIENLHDEKMKNIINKYDSVDKLKENLKFLEQKILIIQEKKQNNSVLSIKNQIQELKKEIYEIENNYELSDYIDKAWDFLKNFNNDDLIIEEKLDLNNSSNSNNILQFINKTGKTNKGGEYNKYYNKCFLNIIHDNEKK